MLFSCFPNLSFKLFLFSPDLFIHSVKISEFPDHDLLHDVGDVANIPSRNPIYPDSCPGMDYVSKKRRESRLDGPGLDKC